MTLIIQYSNLRSPIFQYSNLKMLHSIKYNQSLRLPTTEKIKAIIKDLPTIKTTESEMS